MEDDATAFVKTGSFYTRFFSACKSGNVEKVHLYIEQGGDLTINNNSGIRWASLYGRLETVKYLVEHGADVRAMDDSCVAWAARRGHLAVVKFLIEKGANPHMYNDEALRWASTYGKFEIAKYLVAECGSDIAHVSDRCRAYIIFCQRMEQKARLRAEKQIYFWWIPICYDIDRECGKRMATKSVLEFKRLMQQIVINL